MTDRNPQNQSAQKLPSLRRRILLKSAPQNCTLESATRKQSQSQRPRRVVITRLAWSWAGVLCAVSKITVHEKRITASSISANRVSRFSIS
jgi:hypothetical protein